MHGPGSVPGSDDPRACPCLSRGLFILRHHERLNARGFQEEPGAEKPPARIFGGGAEWPSYSTTVMRGFLIDRLPHPPVRERCQKTSSGRVAGAALGETVIEAESAGAESDEVQ